MKLERALSIIGLDRLPKDEAELNAVYRELAKKLHPDAGGSEAAFQELGEAVVYLKRALLLLNQRVQTKARTEDALARKRAILREQMLRRRAEEDRLRNQQAQKWTIGAAFTFDPKRSQPTTYFSSAIRHALYREVLKQQRIDGRYIPTERILDPAPNRHRTRQEMRALRALRMLTIEDRTLLEDRLIEQITLEQLATEQGCDPRTVSKRVKRAVNALQQAESDLP